MHEYAHQIYQTDYRSLILKNWLFVDWVGQTAESDFTSRLEIPDIHQCTFSFYFISMKSGSSSFFNNYYFYCAKSFAAMIFVFLSNKKIGVFSHWKPSIIWLYCMWFRINLCLLKSRSIQPIEGNKPDHLILSTFYKHLKWYMNNTLLPIAT